MAMSRKRPRKARPRKPRRSRWTRREPSEPPEVTVGIGAPAAEPVADAAVAESGAEAEAAAPARKPGRPGMSLLDFAQWDQDEPAQTADAGSAPAAESRSPLNQSRNRLQRRLTQRARRPRWSRWRKPPHSTSGRPGRRDAARTGAGETIDAAGAIAEAETRRPSNKSKPRLKSPACPELSSNAAGRT